MPKRTHILGIDIGSIAVGVVEVTPAKKILHSAYDFHHGNIEKTLQELLADFALDRIANIATTGSAGDWIKNGHHFDAQLCSIASACHLHNNVKAILNVGGENFGLIQFDQKGRYQGAKTNSACAAGTGSFLDQQAKRLGIIDVGGISDAAVKCRDNRPKIASRCAVFAKTDLIHAQQEGFGLEQICDGLCFGLAKNIVDTVFGAQAPSGGIVFCGGVSKNRRVGQHISDLTGSQLIIDDFSHLYGAAGAALNLIASIESKPKNNLVSVKDNSFRVLPISQPADLMLKRAANQKYFYPPLTLTNTAYPDFKSLEKYLFKPCYGANGFPADVEVDIYAPFLPHIEQDVYLGIDIGSTSTKAVMLGTDASVLAGFYTRTAGRPLIAIQNIFEAIEARFSEQDIFLQIMACGTTGAGRKFAGKVAGADLVVDEISAHARAACQLNEKIDTIIEIGGQDAKFTTLKNQRVTSCAMNTICAAGTGSFIEEQARKLDCALSDYASRTLNQQAPLTSDRCTVFMEKDINHYLSEGYSVNQVLASVLHSVRENYFLKVGNEANVGDVVCFQGATAKNKALVAAFEQRLKKPILVSEFCHLTGAMGAALLLLDEDRKSIQISRKTAFSGLGLYKQQIPVRSEVCTLCTNHCKLSIAEVGGQPVAYGFLCGRDYEAKKRIKIENKAFDLQKSRKAAFSFDIIKSVSGGKTIGIPAALHLVEDIAFWKHFFSLLSIKTITSENCPNSLKRGKTISGAEFCAPVADLHGHVDYLLKQTDYVFLPVYFEESRPAKETRRQYCYYTQFAPALGAAIDGANKQRVLTPLIKYLYTAFHTKRELYRLLKPVVGSRLGFMGLSHAYDTALRHKTAANTRLKQTLAKRLAVGDGVRVVFLGRPYNVLSKSLNSGIPDIFAALGTDCFYQDMLEIDKDELAPIQGLLDEIHWRHAADILAAAHTAALKPGLYPVFVTSFKCTPDSFTLDYFKKIMSRYQKPYLILELDEHDSRIAYETRIEAAVRAFKNHHQNSQPPALVNRFGVNPKHATSMKDKTIVLPNWDPLTMPLLAANLKAEGLDAMVMTETKDSIQRALKHNTGQCIPLNTIAQGFMESIRQNDLDPAQTLLWMSKSVIACNIKLYPHHIRTILKAHGNGFEKAGVYVGNLNFIDVSVKAALNTYFAYMFGGYLRKMGCKIRPYELKKGSTDRVIKWSLKLFSEVFENRDSKEAALEKVIGAFAQIKTRNTKKPLVAVFGDLYTRDNDIMNQGLVHFIEQNGGEVLTTPYHQYVKMVADSYFKKWFTEGNYLHILINKGFMAAMLRLEKIYDRFFQQILKEPAHVYDIAPETILARYHLRPEHTGESMDNILKIHYLKKFYPNLSLFIQANPALCCPSLVTEAMSHQIEKQTGVPVVSITYDGTGGSKNDVLIPYLKYPRMTGIKNEKPVWAQTG
jgi:predicted CoA-substrate-specific enzyme activase